ncbi:MAG: hypothetical protein ACYSUC_02570 [Planctomycetota bacterium]|jgi:hypothetical protein
MIPIYKFSPDYPVEEAWWLRVANPRLALKHRLDPLQPQRWHHLHNVKWKLWVSPDNLGMGRRQEGPSRIWFDGSTYYDRKSRS